MYGNLAVYVGLFKTENRQKCSAPDSAGSITHCPDPVYGVVGPLRDRKWAWKGERKDGGIKREEGGNVALRETLKSLS